MEDQIENQVEKAYTFFRFEDLRIYHKSIEYIEMVYDNTELFPDNEADGLKSKLIETSQSITLKIAEGSSRNKTQFIHFLKLAKSSVRECLIYTTLAKNRQYISQIAEEESRNILIEMTKMIGALISSLQKSLTREPNHNNYPNNSSNNNHSKNSDYNEY
ncbi:MAG: four helix bundle protein [Bacteroidales bacterium]|nr:four helix bundle protein [Bacteroidales bacterium]